MQRGPARAAMCLGALLVLAPSKTGRAHELEPDGALQAEHASTSLYAAAREPRQRQARALLQEAVVSLQRAASALPSDFRHVCERLLAPSAAGNAAATSEGQQRALATLASQALARRDLLDAALVALDRALLLSPRDPDLLYARAHVLSRWETPRTPTGCDVERRDLEATQALETLIAVDPGYDSMRIAFELGVMRTRMRDFEAAAQAYLRAIALAWSEESTATARANLAEVTMLAGDPLRALPHYRRAIAASAGGPDYALAQLGLAVALDRLGEHVQALDAATKSVEAQNRSLSVLESDGVFFEPAYERHYYRALSFEALAALEPARRAEHLESARSAYAAFVAQAAQEPRDARAAQADLALVTRAIAALPKPRKLDALQRGTRRGAPLAPNGGAR